MFVRDSNPPNLDCDIYVMGADGTNVVNLTNNVPININLDPA